MGKARLCTILVATAILASACSSSSDDAAGTDANGAGTNGECSSAPFTGEVASAGDDANAEFSLSDSDIVLAQAYALAEEAQYTVYLADYDLGDQGVGGSSTIEADDGHVVVTMQARNPDQGWIELDTTYDETFVIMDSGGGASASPDEPEGTVTFTELSDDRIRFEVAFEDPGLGQILDGTVSATVIR